MAGKIREIEADQFETTVLQADAAVVDFYSTECPPCEALASKYEALSNIYGDDIVFVKIFRQGNRELAASLGVSGSPTLLFYKRGERVGDLLAGGIKRSDIMRNLDALIDKNRAEALKSRIVPVKTETDVLVFGAGPAGLTAGIYLAQAHIDTIVVDPSLAGGYVSTTHQVSNYPGFTEPQPGMMLAHYMGEQSKAAGAGMRLAVEVSDINLEEKSCLIDGYEQIRAKRVIIASGSSPRPLGLSGEVEYRGQGISYCATCDGKYFQDKEIVVIGGGNSAIEESLFLTKFASKVTVVHQFDNLQANKEAQKQAFANEKMEFLLSHEPREFKRYGQMDMGVVIEDLKTGKTRELRTAGIFVFVGFIPNLDGFESDLERDQWGYLKKDQEMRTNMEGVYAVGDVASKPFRQITIAVAEGTIAAMSISKELS